MTVKEKCHCGYELVECPDCEELFCYRCDAHHGMICVEPDGDADPLAFED